jgi:uncharacterized protein YkwD
MRKPLMVVCVVTSVVMIAGGIAATTAGAGTDPDLTTLPGPTVPSTLPGLPWSSADPFAPDPLASDPLASDPPAAGPSASDPAGADPLRTDPADPSAIALPPSTDQPPPAPSPGDQTLPIPAGQNDDPSTPTPATSTVQAAPARPADVAPAAQHPAAQDPVALRPAARPADPKAITAQQPAALSLDAAARQEVTAASVSTSPEAPVQQQILALVNLNRRRARCGSLSLDRRLILAAQGHATDMAHRVYFAHNSRTGATVAVRVTHAGYRWQRYGENIARGLSSPYQVVDAWMHSPEHRENIMDCRLHQMGIGLAFGANRTTYWVQDFATPL